MKHTYLAKTLLILTGLWKYQKGDLTRNQHICYKIYGIFNQINYFTLNVCLVYGIKDVEGAAEKIDALAFIIFCNVVVLKMFIVQRENVRKIINYMEDFDQQLSKLDDDNLKIYFSTAKYNFIYSLILFGYSTMSGITIALCKYLVYKEQLQKASEGLIDPNDVTKPLPFYAWRPFDSKEHYFLAFSIDVLLASIGCSINTATQVTYLSLMTFIIGQLKMLQNKFRKYGSLCTQLESEEEQLEYLISIIKEHKKIISFVKELDENMKYILFFEFTMNPLQITSVVYQFLVFKLDNMIYFRVSWLCCMIFQMFTLTWHANEIQLNSINVSDSVYESEWYDLSNRIKKHLSFIIIRAQRPLSLSVGPFFILSNRTAVTSLKGAYSYLAILNNRRNE